MMLLTYAGLAAGGLWLAETLNRGIPHATTSGLAASLPPAAAFLDENGHPRFDPEALKRFLQEINLVQHRLDDHHRRLEQRIEQATR